MKSPRTQIFASGEYESRIRKVREGMEINGLDVLVIHSPENIYYLSGYQTPGYYWYQALVLPLNSEAIFIAPPHEAALIPEFSWVEDSRVYPDTSDWAQITGEILKELSLTRSSIGLETNSRFLTVDFYQSIQSLLPDAQLIDGSGIVESCRLIKSASEIEYMRKAADVSSRGMKAGIKAVIEGASELEVAAAVHSELDMAGSEYTGLPAFITSGERSHLVHATWSPKLIDSGDLVFMEIPGSVNRYHAAQSRSVFVGEQTQKLIEANRVATEALETAKASMKQGVAASSVFKAGSSVINEANIGYKQGRRIAYGIGTAFPPGWDEGDIFSINIDESRSLLPGMCFHLITTMRVPGLGAIGCSDTVLVTDEGVETLTNQIKPGVQY